MINLTRRDWIGEFWRYRELFYFFVWRDLKVRYKQTLLGAAWAVIQPFFTMVVFSIFFSRIAQIPSDGIPYPLFSYAALLPWTYFSVAITNAGNSLTSNSDLLTKVYFPRSTIPASAAISGLLDFAIAFVVILGLMAYYQFTPSWGLLLWPLLMAPLIMLALGVGMFMAALNAKYRDIKYALPFIINLWLFITPIIYPTSMLPAKWQPLLALNPLTGIIEAFRASAFRPQALDWRLLGISSAVTLVVLLGGALYFRKTERVFADVI